MMLPLPFIVRLIMVALWNRADHYIFALWFLIAALHVRCGHYIFVLFLLFSSPNLSGRRLDVYHTSTGSHHDVILV